jgi:hypothetical protein
MKKRVVTISFVAFTLSAAASSVHAQPSTPRFEAAAHVVTANSSQFDVTDIGAGGRFAWRPTTLLGVEAELNLFPREFPNDNGFSAGRAEALFGATAGPQLGRVRPFVKARPGLLRFSGPSEPVACILIFPPPLSCTLAAGRTLFALDIGGGIELSAGGNAFARIDAGDRLIRYPGTVFDNNFVARDSSFFSHDFRFTAGAGVRF